MFDRWRKSVQQETERALRSVAAARRAAVATWNDSKREREQEPSFGPIVPPGVVPPPPADWLDYVNAKLAQNFGETYSPASSARASSLPASSLSASSAQVRPEDTARPEPKDRPVPSSTGRPAAAYRSHVGAAPEHPRSPPLRQTAGHTQAPRAGAVGPSTTSRTTATTINTATAVNAATATDAARERLRSATVNPGRNHSAPPDVARWRSWLARMPGPSATGAPPAASSPRPVRAFWRRAQTWLAVAPNGVHDDSLAPLARDRIAETSAATTSAGEASTATASTATASTARPATNRISVDRPATRSSSRTEAQGPAEKAHAERSATPSAVTTTGRRPEPSSPAQGLNRRPLPQLFTFNHSTQSSESTSAETSTRTAQSTRPPRAATLAPSPDPAEPAHAHAGPIGGAPRWTTGHPFGRTHATDPEDNHRSVAIPQGPRNSPAHGESHSVSPFRPAAPRTQAASTPNLHDGPAQRGFAGEPKPPVEALPPKMGEPRFVPIDALPGMARGRWPSLPASQDGVSPARKESTTPSIDAEQRFA